MPSKFWCPCPAQKLRCYLPQVVGQTHILREAFAPTTNVSRLPMGATPHQLTTSDVAEKPRHTISVLIICMDGGDVSREDRVRVRVSLAGDSDDWRESERFGGAINPSAVSGVGVVDEETAVCRWDRPRVSKREVRAQDNVSHIFYFSDPPACRQNLSLPFPLPLPPDSTRLSFTTLHSSDSPKQRILLFRTRSSAARKPHLQQPLENC